MRSGELFAGVGGLGMAVDRVFGSRPSWFCEFDTAPSKVLKHHHPDVPNFGDVTKVDWKSAPPVRVLAGGFPCQDVSLAGRRRGMGEGTRSGLWSEFAKAIDTLRPDWVVIENVRGLLSADANSNMEPCPLCVGDDPRHVLRALGAVLGDLAELGFDAEWTGIRASDVGAPHGRFRVFILAWPAEHTDSGGRDKDGRRGDVTPMARRGSYPADASAAQDSGDRARQRGLKLFSTPDTVPEAPNTGSNSHKAGNIVGLGNQVMWLLPTPIVSDGTGGSKNIAESVFSPQMRDITKLLPTPTAMDSSASGGSNESNVTLTDAVVRTELGTRANERLLPTPNVAMAEGGQTSRSGTRKDELLLGGIAAEHATDWGPYADAIARWEAVIGRPAPTPVRFDGKGGKPRLNPDLCEWMMGWPAGHVTDPAIGLTRAEQLKACGNGVVPQQAEAALREMLVRPGVPSLEIEA